MSAPQMSVIILWPDRYETVQRILACLEKQTAREELELVFVVAAGALDRHQIGLLAGFWGVKEIEIPEMTLTARARAAGIQAASAPIVVLTEDHSFPEPEWAQALIESHHDCPDCAGVGPAMKNANPGSLLSWANFLIEYSAWLDPVPGREASHIPGHNSSYKRDLLLEYGDSLEEWLEAESLLHWDLKEKGFGLRLEPRARTRHLNFSLFLPSLSLRFQAGRLFAGLRRNRMSAVSRIAFTGAFLLIPLVRLARILAEFRLPDRPSGKALAALPWVCVLLLADALGEAAGYVSGPGRSAQHIARIDFHREKFLNARDMVFLNAHCV